MNVLGHNPYIKGLTLFGSLVFATNVAFAEEAEIASTAEKIVVKGEKVEKSIKDTTTAVTVIGGSDLTTTEFKSVDEVAASAANVTTTGFGSVTIRGIDGKGSATGGIAFRTGAAARVATLVDGVSQSWAGYNFTPSNLWDVAQVEILKGPQSTLQGNSSIGGAMVSSTNDPTYFWQSAVRAGSEMYENGNFMSNLAVMSSGPIIDDELAYRIAIDGSTGESYMTYTEGSTAIDNLDDLDDMDNLNSRLKLLWEPASLSGLSAKLTTNYSIFEGNYLNWANDDDATNVLDGANTRIQDSVTYSVASDVDYQFSQSLSNSFHASYGVQNVEFAQYPSSFDVYSDTQNLALENRVQLTALDSKLSALAGLYYANNQQDQGVSTSWVNDFETTSMAAYGEATYQVVPALRVIAGGRVENQDIARSATGSIDYATDSNETIVLPKLAAIYDVNDAVTLNASVRKGYNAGGEGYDFWDDYDWDYYEYDSETVIAYEAGLIATQGSSLVTVNLFFNDYADYQALNSSTYKIENVDDARTYGVAIAGSSFVTASTELSSSVGFTKTEVVSYSADSAYEGNELPSAPAFDVSAGITQYLGDSFKVSADVMYVGEYYSDLSNDEDLLAGDYVTANLRAGYIWNDLEADVYIKNLANEEIIYFDNSDRWSVGQTRTVGFNLTYRM